MQNSILQWFAGKFLDRALSPLRVAFLESKIALVWQPLLAALNARGWLPADWRRIVRCALFCCPTLVMDLRAGGSADHTPITSAIGLAVAIMMGSEPEGGGDVLSAALDRTQSIAALTTGPEWPERRARGFPVVASQSRAVLSWLAVASQWPSRLIARQLILS